MADPPLDPRSPADSASEITELMMPLHVNNVGNVFGGVLLSMVDKAAALAAMRHSRRACVTVSIDRVEFQEAIYAGDLVTCKAQVNYVGRTSMEIGVCVWAENPVTGVRRHTNDCFLTFVALGADGRPTPVRPLELVTEDEVRRAKEGEVRRDHRSALVRKLARD